MGFHFNPYDPCVTNREKGGSQHTIRFHVDDIMSSHKDAKVNDEFYLQMNDKYGELKEVSVQRGNTHDFLGMTFEFGNEQVCIRMVEHVSEMINQVPGGIKKEAISKTPAGQDLFSRNENSPKLCGEAKEGFHSNVAKGIFIVKRGRPDIQTAIAVLSTRVCDPSEEDLEKLRRVCRYLNGTKDLFLCLSIDDLNILKWYVDAAYAVHPDFKSHSGGVLLWGQGTIIVQSIKQKINTRSSTEAEIVAVDDLMNKIVWTKLFVEAQGYSVKENILFQDNKSAIQLENNGKMLSGKRTRAMNIRYFFCD